jgi:hypothetical protein
MPKMGAFSLWVEKHILTMSQRGKNNNEVGIKVT